MEARRKKVQLSIISPTGYASSSCGYCTAPASGKRSTQKSSKSYGVWAHRLSPYHYQTLIDQGWRRSGDYLYKPDLLRTCCPQIPIRLLARDFQPRKGHKRALANLLFQVRQTRPKPAKWKGRWSRGRDWDVESRWSEIVDSPENTTSSSAWAEQVAGPITRKLQVRLALASTSDEKYQLFRKYQARVHGESEDDISSKKGFCRFLVDTSLALTWPSTGEPLTQTQETQWRDLSWDSARLPLELPYGCYHQEYRLDDKLVAVGVIDVLPKCVSSVYVFYDPDYNEWELGKVSALQEISLTRRLGRLRDMHDIAYYYMGFYIHTCQKMKYKAEYRPSQLLDCSKNTWRNVVNVASGMNAKQFFGWSDSQPRSPQGDELDEELDQPSHTQKQSSRLPTQPSPPPGMLDSRAIIRALEQRLRGADSSGPDSRLEMLQGAMVLEARSEAEGIKPLLMSNVLWDYVQGKQGSEDGEDSELVQAVECIAALANPELVSQTVQFI